MSVEEVSTLITTVEATDPEMAALLFVAATTGCRRGELCGLRWSDVDLAGATLTVRRSITDTSRGVEEKDPKTHRSRASPSTPRPSPCCSASSPT